MKNIDKETRDYHAQNNDELLIEKKGIAVFKISTDKPFLKVYVDGKFRLKWRPDDAKGAYNMARQVQFEDLQEEAAQALGA